MKKDLLKLKKMNEFLNEYGKEGFLELFFSEYLYSLIITTLRLGHEDPSKDLELRFHLVGEKKLNFTNIFSIKDKEEMEREIRNYCNKKAKKSMKKIKEKLKQRGITIDKLLSNEDTFGQILKETFEEIFEVEWGKKYKEMEETEEIFFDDRLSKKVLKRYDKSKHIKMSYNYSKKENVFYIPYHFKDIEKQFKGEKLFLLVRDLLNISVALYFSDKVLPRKNSLIINMPVSDKELWDSVKPYLRDTISILTNETYDFNFYKSIKRKIKIGKEKKEKNQYDCVCLFSGGLDSLSGILYLFKKGKNPLAISVGSGKLKKKQEELFKALPISRRKKSKQYKINISSWNTGEAQEKFNELKNKRSDQWEVSLRSRSFLFLSIATAFAIANDLNEIYIPENGVMALIDEIPISPSYFGTRTAHPQFFLMYQELIRKIFKNKHLKVINPFMYYTKSELIEKNVKKQDLIKIAVSCSNFSRKKKPCGKCVPCIMRRIAMKHLEVNDVSCKFDVFNFPDHEITGSKITEKKKDAYISVLNLIELTHKILKYNKEDKKDFLVDFPLFEDKNVRELYISFAEECKSAFEKFSKEYDTFGEIYKKMIS